MENMILIMVDECGDEVEVERYTVSEDGEFKLDEDELEIWKARKIEKAAEDYPEARGFYFEDRRGWGHRINAGICGLGWDFVDEFLYGAP